MASDSSASPAAPRLSASTLVLAATVFLSAWLLFQVQPMVAKRILPWFGGGPAVWTTTMLFFQTALLGGYFYAHWLAKTFAPEKQFRVHVALLAAAAVLLVVNPAIPSDAWKPASSGQPAWSILVLLAATIGMPYVLLAATAPLVQAWYAGSARGGSPYRLYALSNLGSLAALFTYPFLVEPNIGAVRQGIVWSGLFGLFVILCGATGRALTRGRTTMATSEQPGPAAEDAPPPALHRFLWVALPTCASVTLLAVTNYLTQDVASFPLLWILPLAVYLITFIATFDSDRWYVRWAWMPLVVATSFAASYTWYEGPYVAIHWQLATHLGLLLAIGMVCHGEVARLRPAAGRLTSFYLAIAAGGALGGLLGSIVAPLALSDRYELQLTVVAAWILGLIVLATDRRSPFFDGKIFPAWIAMVVGLVVFTVVARNFCVWNANDPLVQKRNFYGALRVTEKKVGPPNYHYRKLTNGRISHGAQFILEENRRVPVQYYYPATGVAQALLTMPAGRPHRVGVVGLGAGVIASFAERGDYCAFYEINPQVLEIANEYFTYLADAKQRGANVEILEGDARLLMERSSPQKFDVLVLDAFSGDAIPVHLLTQEALDLAWSHVAKPDGVLVVHVSNLHLDLRPVVHAAEKRHELSGVIVVSSVEGSPIDEAAQWVLLAADPGRLANIENARPLVDSMGADRTVLWTDDYSDLLEIVKYQ